MLLQVRLPVIAVIARAITAITNVVGICNSCNSGVLYYKELLRPLVKHKELVTLDKKYAIYESNRRNQAKALKRLAVTAESAGLVDEGSGVLAKHQKLYRPSST